MDFSSPHNFFTRHVERPSYRVRLLIRYPWYPVFVRSTGVILARNPVYFCFARGRMGDSVTNTIHIITGCTKLVNGKQLRLLFNHFKPFVPPSGHNGPRFFAARNYIATATEFACDFIITSSREEGCSIFHPPCYISVSMNSRIRFYK